MTRTHLLYGLLVVGSLCLILFVWLHGGNTPDADKTIRDQHSGVDSPAVSDAPAQAKHGHGVLNHGGFVSEEDYSPPPPEVPVETLERIEAIYNSMPYSKAKKKEIEILTEGMDTLSAAKYLETLNGQYGDFDAIVRKYAERAVAENPGDFDALLFKTQRTEDEQEREAGYRQLLEMNSDSVDVLVGLGNILSYPHPEEAIGLFQKAVALAPEHPGALYGLSASYQAAGQLTKALPVAEKVYQITSHFTMKAHLDSIKWNIEKRRNQHPDVQEKGTEPSKTDSTDVSVPSETEAPLGEAPFDESPITEPSAKQDDARKKRARQEMEAEFEQLLTDLERMVTGESDLSDAVESDLSDAVRGEIADLERESKLKLSSDDERVRRNSESYQKRRERSAKRSEDDEDRDDARVDEDASEEDEER